MRCFRVGAVALTLLLALAAAPAGQAVSAAGEDSPDSPFEALLSAREAEMGRTVDPGQRPAVLARIAALETPNAIGDSAADLVFTPLAPCRTIDTRVLTAGILTAGTPRAFVVAGDSAVFTAQGGQAGGCGVPVGATAAMLNLVATESTGPGNLRAKPWAAGTPVMPNASVINFGVVSGLPALANGLAVPICDPAATTCTYDLYVQSFASDTHFVADVVGYFRSVTGVLKGAQAPLEVSGSSVRLSTAGCGAGYVWKYNGSAWACVADANTTYSATAPLSQSGTTFGLSTSGCGAGYVWKYSGSAWACSPDIDTNTTYSAGTGLSLSGTTFSADPTGFMQTPSFYWHNSSISFGDAYETIASASLYAPVAGRILAIASGTMVSSGPQQVNSVLTTSSTGTCCFGGGTSFSGEDSTTTMGYFDVAAGSTTTVYWRAYHTNPAYPARCYTPRIALIFIPS